MMNDQLEPHEYSLLGWYKENHRLLCTNIVCFICSPHETKNSDAPHWPSRTIVFKTEKKPAKMLMVSLYYSHWNKLLICGWMDLSIQMMYIWPQHPGSTRVSMDTEMSLNLLFFSKTQQWDVLWIPGQNKEVYQDELPVKILMETVQRLKKSTQTSLLVTAKPVSSNSCSLQCKSWLLLQLAEACCQDLPT